MITAGMVIPELNILNIMQDITPFFWFDTQAEEAVAFYTSLFNNSEIVAGTRYTEEGKEIHGMDAGSVMTIDFRLSGQNFTALNGGPLFTFNPSISFFVVCDSENETDRLWNRLSNGGQAIMPLDRYDWSEKYGFVQDKYGICWQLSLGTPEDIGQKITPCFLFVNEMMGKAEAAIEHYTSIFNPSGVDDILKYNPGEKGQAGTVKLAQFSLLNSKFMAMDGQGQHDFSFNEAISFLVNCETADEVDYYWDQLTKDGDPESHQCGWLKDKFGISWQVVPTALFEMLRDKDPVKIKRVTAAMLNMKKLDLVELQKAFAGQ